MKANLGVEMPIIMKKKTSLLVGIIEKFNGVCA